MCVDAHTDTYIHTCATSSVVDGFVGCLHFLAVVSSVAMRIGVHVS